MRRILLVLAMSSCGAVPAGAACLSSWQCADDNSRAHATRPYGSYDSPSSSLYSQDRNDTYKTYDNRVDDPRDTPNLRAGRPLLDSPRDMPDYRGGRKLKNSIYDF